MSDAYDKGANDLLVRLSEDTEDIIDEVCAETWPGGEEEWWDHDMPVSASEAHSERTYATVMERLADRIQEAGQAALDRANAIEPWRAGRDTDA